MLGFIAAFCPSYCKLRATLLFRYFRHGAGAIAFSDRAARWPAIGTPLLMVFAMFPNLPDRMATDICDYQ
jgi:hypothetical protein